MEYNVSYCNYMYLKVINVDSDKNKSVSNINNIENSNKEEKRKKKKFRW